MQQIDSLAPLRAKLDEMESEVRSHFRRAELSEAPSPIGVFKKPLAITFPLDSASTPVVYPVIEVPRANLEDQVKPRPKRREHDSFVYSTWAFFFGKRK